MSGGIYSITNKFNSKRYVGSTIDFDTRWYQHINTLEGNIHDNPYLQNAWNKYGADGFEFEVLEYVLDRNDLLVIEQYYLDWLTPEYNIVKVAGPSMLGRNHTEQTRSKMREAHLGKQFTQEHRRRISEARKGKKHTTETKAKIGRAHRGMCYAKRS